MSRILIFDAFPSIRELLAKELVAEGNIVVAAGNPDLIPNLINTFGPDLLILDPFTPGGMKWDLIESAKAQNPRIPIILFTECSFPDPRFDRADACLPKSYILHQLRQKIKEITEKTAPRKDGL